MQQGQLSTANINKYKKKTKPKPQSSPPIHDLIDEGTEPQDHEPTHGEARHLG